MTTTAEATPQDTPSPSSRSADRQEWIAATARIAVAIVVLTGVAGIGVLAWEGEPSNLFLLLLLPLVMNFFPWRYWPLVVAMAYFGVGNVELPVVIERFTLGETGPVAQWTLAALLTLAQSLPFWIYRADRPPVERAIRMALALALLTIPPVGLVSWRNPLLLAGLITPAMGALGLLITTVVFAAMAGGGFSRKKERRGIAIAAGIALVLAVGSMAREVRAPVTDQYGWIGFDTSIQPSALRDPLEIREVVPGEVAAEALAAGLDEGMEVMVLPESILAPASLADEIALLQAADRARKAGAVLLVGETIQTGPEHWRNTIRAMGAIEGTIAESRLPMPFGNWRLTGGVPARPFASDVVPLALPSGMVRVATSLCFEDTVIWPHVGLLTGQAEVMVSMANSWATDGTRGDRAQTRSAKLLARLGGVPLVRARNTYEGSER